MFKVPSNKLKEMLGRLGIKERAQSAKCAQHQPVPRVHSNVELGLRNLLRNQFSLQTLKLENLAQSKSNTDDYQTKRSAFNAAQKAQALSSKIENIAKRKHT